MTHANVSASGRVRHMVVMSPVPKDPVPLSSFLAEHLGWPRDHALHLIRLGAVYRNKKRQMDDVPIALGDYFRVHAEPRRYRRPEDLFAEPLFENDHFLIVDKPSGVPCHSTVDNGIENLSRWWSDHRGYPLRITHRIDVPTSGCLVLAKSTEAIARFNKVLSRGHIRKSYDALVEGRFEHEGLIRHWMRNDEWSPRYVRREPFDDALECRLIVHGREWIPSLECTRLAIELETGRTHQIRAQMADLGHPIVQDDIYGNIVGQRPFGLIARSLEFQCPFTSEMITVRSRRVLVPVL